MNDRLVFREFLKTICPNLYFQPPSNINMIYPCIIYRINNVDTAHANNNPYLQFLSYQLTVVDKNPDSDIFKRLLKQPMCRFERSYVADNLNHFIFNIYY